MHALGYDDVNQLQDGVKISSSKKDGFLTWSEFLDFFFKKESSIGKGNEGVDWWNKLDNKGLQIH